MQGTERTDAGLDSESENDYKAEKKCFRLIMGEDILRHMFVNINDEDPYIHYFKQLIEFEEFVKSNEHRNLEKFKIVHYDVSNGTKVCKIKNSGQRKISNKKITSKNKPEEEIILKVNFAVEPFQKRTKLRHETFRHFHKYCNDKESYECFINRLQTLEENFINKLYTV